MRRFAGVGMISDRIPGKTTILAFRHLLKKRREREQIFATVKDHLKKRDMARKQGTIIDASLIAVPSSTLTEARG
jgi:transposase, IS5 family